MSTPTGGAERVEQAFAVAMVVRQATQGLAIDHDLVAGIVRDAVVSSERLDLFVKHQAALTSATADAAGHLATALLRSRTILEHALAALDAGRPLTAAQIGMDGDGVMRTVGLSVQIDAANAACPPG